MKEVGGNYGIEKDNRRDAHFTYDRTMNYVEASLNYVLRYGRLREVCSFVMTHKQTVLAHFVNHQRATVLAYQIGHDCDDMPTPTAMAYQRRSLLMHIKLDMHYNPTSQH
eukprot:6979908-Pyramimonas_sp.AAC.1